MKIQGYLRESIHGMKTLVFTSLIVIALLMACQDSLPEVDEPEVTTSTIPVATATMTPSPTPSPTQAPSATPTPTISPPLSFEGDSAFELLLEQMAFGPRWPGSEGNKAAGDFIISELQQLGWEVEEQVFPFKEIEVRNIIGRKNMGYGPVIIIGAHYDTRKVADRTPGSTEPVPGAVDGASGVAVLLELARVLDLADLHHEIWLAFFDAEDNGDGGIPGFPWIVGSTYMAESLAIMPQAMVLVDMVGDADQQIYYELNSDFALRQELWRIAADLGFGSHFIAEEGKSILDDHIPFLNMGIPAVDIIDIDYLYWHTVEDTADKASPDSLERVGRTLEEWIEKYLSG